MYHLLLLHPCFLRMSVIDDIPKPTEATKENITDILKKQGCNSKRWYI